jgi:hypothetical protein
MVDATRGPGSYSPVDPYPITSTPRGAESQGIVTGTPSDWFGPLNPMAPIAPKDVAGRVFDFPSGFNLTVKPRAYEPVTFAQLRGLADTYDLLRLVIETRKDQLARIAWNISPRDEDTAGDEPSDKDKARIKAIEKFFKKPDGYNNWDYWLRLLLEDLFVIDAPTLFIERSRAGKMISLRPIDGSSIKRVIDNWGRTPQYPLPAFQQELKGFPALDYTTRDILYRPRNPRVNKVYGFSPVEQIMMTVNIALRRQVWQLQYYTEGNVPEALIGVPETWTPDQVLQFQTSWDALMAGSTGARRHAKFVPNGVGKTFHATKEPEQKNDFDEWLARLVCFAFSIPPTAFTRQMSRASADNAHDQAAEEGLAPTQLWLKNLIDDVLENEFDAGDLEFKWQDDKEVDPVKQEVILTGYVKTGVMTLNEARGVIGLDPVDEPEADTLMALTGMAGFVPIQAGTAQEEDRSESHDQQLEQGQESHEQRMANPQAPAAPGAQPAKPTPKAAAKPAKQSGGAQKGVGKPADIPFVKTAGYRRLPALHYTRPLARKAEAGMSKAIAKTLQTIGGHVARKVRAKLKSLGKVDDPGDHDHNDRAHADMLWGQIVNEVDISGINDVAEDSEAYIAEVAQDSAGQLLAQLGVDDKNSLVDQVNERAAAWAKDRAAELVSFDDDADASIVDATIEGIRRIVTNGLLDNIGKDEIADAIEAGYAFSPERADLIARTEISRANSMGSLVGARGARDELGMDLKKEWSTAGDDKVDEDICQPNEDQGPIGLDDYFDSGDESVPGHPNCRCVMVYQVDESQSADDADDNAAE